MTYSPDLDELPEEEDLIADLIDDEDEYEHHPLYGVVKWPRRAPLLQVRVNDLDDDIIF